MQKQKSSFLNRVTGSEPEVMEEQDVSSMPVYSDDTEYSNNVQTTDREMTEEQYSRSYNNETEDSAGQLTIDVYQTETEIVIKSTIAGVKPENIDVTMSNDMITIRGERKQDENIPEEDYYYQECYWGPFSRSIVLPMDVIADKIDASLKNGILTIKLPKADTLIAKKIQVRGF